MPECSASALQIGQQPPDGAGGHQGALLTFTNISGTACFLQGYPGVAAQSRSHRTVANAARTLSGYMGGLPSGATTPPRVTLTPGRVAYATVEAQDTAANGSASCPGTAAATLLVTAPDQRISTSLADEIRICAAFQVHPVISAPHPPGG